MAGLTSSRETRGQFAAIARVRWQLFANSLRTLRGRLEMVSRLFFALSFAMLGIGGAVGLAFLARFIVSHFDAEWIASPLWVLFLGWQLVPVLATAFTEQLDSSNLLRFPLTYPSYFFIRLAYGSFDPGTVIGLLWLLGLALGIWFAKPLLSLWAVPALLIFAILNILLARTIFAWIERWLARRRTREIMGVVFFILIIGFQFISPAISHFAPKNRRAASDLTSVAQQYLPIERALPPGLAAAAIAHAAEGQVPAATRDFALLCAYPLVFVWLLNVRLRAQYHGENLSEAVAAKPVVVGKPAIRPGWAFPGLPGPISAIIEKEFHYLLRSGPMLFTLIMPVVVLFIFRLTPSAGRSGSSILSSTSDLAFPIGAAYGLLILTNLVFNSFGGDHMGVQIFFAAPVRFREVLIAKNLAHAAVIGFEMLFLWIGAALLFRPPAIGVTLATLAGMLFALLVSMTVGNLLSIYSPRKIDLGAFGRQKAPAATQFAAMGAQLVVFGIGAVIFLAARYYHAIWLATVAFLAFAAVSFAVYLHFLARTEKLALSRREVLIAELARA